MASKQQEKSGQTRQELKEAAYQLFLEKGYDRTTIAEITSRAGYATGSFYRHWKEKEELFQIIQDELVERIKEFNRDAIANITSLEQIVDLLVNLFIELTRNRTTLRLFVESPQKIRNDQFFCKMKDLLSFCTNLLSVKIQTLSPGRHDEFSSRHTANLIYSFLSGYILLSSINIEVPPIEALHSALMTILQAESAHPNPSSN